MTDETYLSLWRGAVSTVVLCGLAWLGARLALDPPKETPRTRANVLRGEIDRSFDEIDSLQKKTAESDRASKVADSEMRRVSLDLLVGSCGDDLSCRGRMARIARELLPGYISKVPAPARPERDDSG